MPKTRPNDTCPCGSGRKYKHCCLNLRINAITNRHEPRCGVCHGPMTYNKESFSYRYPRDCKVDSSPPLSNTKKIIIASIIGFAGGPLP